ncbi:MAG TPA: hypothetical protein VHF50_01965 [Solirubrobacterales bacterium]|nr:hypothetical protein [Solirubrobacterales bacterium]
MEALRVLAGQLREEATPISSYVLNPTDGGGGSLVIESVREGYLLHYGESRLLSGHDPDLALLAGDYLYALGIERLAALGDAAAVGVLAELIGRCAQLHTEGREDEVPELWRTAVAAVGGTG